MKRRHFVFYFIMIYMCVLLPLSLVSVIITNKTIHHSEKKITDEFRHNVVKAANALETTYATFEDDALFLFTNDEIRSNLAIKDERNARNAIRILKNIWNFDSLDTIFALYYGDDNVYYYEGLASKQVFWEQVLNCTQESQILADQIIYDNESRISILHSTSGETLFIYHIPVGPDAQGNPRSLECISKSRDIAKMLSEYIPQEQVVLQIQVDNRQMWFHNIGNNLQHISQKQGLQETARREFAMIQESDQNTVFHITLWYDTQQELAELYKLRNTSLCLLICGFTISMLLSLTFSLKRVNQVEELAQNLSSKEIAHRKKRKFNEFDYIQSLVNIPLTELSEMRQSKKVYRKLLSVQTARVLFHGGINQEEEALSILNACGIELFEDYFFLCGMHLETTDDCIKLEHLMFEDLYYIHPSDNKYYLVVWQELSARDSSQKTRRNQSLRLRDLLRHEGIVCRCVVASQVYDRVTKARFAYYEVISMLKNTDLDKAFLCWEDCQSRANISSLIGSTYVEKFQSALSQRDAVAAITVVDEVNQNVKDYSSREYIRCLLLQTIVLEAEQEDAIGTTLQNNLDQIDLHDADAFQSGINKILTELFREPEKSITEILAFVEDNYCSPLLSLETVAEFAGFSKAKLSKMFLSKTGKHYLAYITQLRMEKMAAMLVNTDLSIRDIVLLVGYSDTVNASRKFKTHFGVTPSQYRNSYQGEQR